MIKTILALVTVIAGFFAYFKMNKNIVKEPEPKSEPEQKPELEQKPEPEKSRETPKKAREALIKAIADGDTKTEKWIRTSIVKGYEGVGVIPYIRKENKVLFVLGINKKGEAEYPGGKCEDQDNDLASTVRREVVEEIGLLIDKNRFVNGLQITGGTTGYPSYVFLVEINEADFNLLYSIDGTFSKFILTENIVDCDLITDYYGIEYELRKFNKKYVIPQIRDSILKIV